MFLLWSLLKDMKIVNLLEFLLVTFFLLWMITSKSMVIQLLSFIHKISCTDENGRITSNDAINQTEFQDLIQLVDEIISKNIRITILSEIVGIEPKSYFYFI